MLTDTAVRQAKPKDKPYKLGDSGGLYLLVKSNGKYCPTSVLIIVLLANKNFSHWRLSCCRFKNQGQKSGPDP